jgi:hypothetical protein
MSDWASEFAGDVVLLERKQNEWHSLKSHQNFRNNIWRTKNGQELAIKNMSDSHLLNAYKQSGQSNLFKEMVIRLFETKIGIDHDINIHHS